MITVVIVSVIIVVALVLFVIATRIWGPRVDAALAAPLARAPLGATFSVPAHHQTSNRLVWLDLELVGTPLLELAVTLRVGTVEEQFRVQVDPDGEVVGLSETLSSYTGVTSANRTYVANADEPHRFSGKFLVARFDSPDPTTVHLTAIPVKGTRVDRAEVLVTT